MRNWEAGIILGSVHFGTGLWKRRELIRRGEEKKRKGERG
jgi:hypothetical protein